MAEQILNGILTTLATAITSTGQTAGIQINAIPATVIAGTVRLVMAGTQEVITVTSTTGTGPYTLVGVTRNVEGGTAGTYAIGTTVEVGAITAALLNNNLPYVNAVGTNLLLSSNGSTYSVNVPLANDSSPGIVTAASYTFVKKLNDSTGTFNVGSGQMVGALTFTNQSYSAGQKPYIQATSDGSGIQTSGGTIVDDSHGNISSGANITATGRFIGLGTGITGLIGSQIGIYTGSFTATGTATAAFVVTIGTTQSGTTYKVAVTPTNLLSAAVFYVTAKSTTQFTVTYLAGLTGAVAFDWILVQ